jgi:hypothetical protein
MAKLIVSLWSSISPRYKIDGGRRANFVMPAAGDQVRVRHPIDSR